MRVFFIFFVIALSSCRDEHNKIVQDPLSTSIDSPAINSEIKTADSISGTDEKFNVQVDTLIQLAFPDDSDTLEASGELSSAGQHITCLLKIDRKVGVEVKILPDDKDLNIRISQIIDPAGESDGPFGRTLNYELKKKGEYKLLIGPNMMADGKRGGKFRLQVKVNEPK